MCMNYKILLLLFSVVRDPEHGPHFQGDMLQDIWAGSKQGLIDEEKRWPGATLIFEISQDFSEHHFSIH